MKLQSEGLDISTPVHTVPTIGMNLEEISVKNVKIKVWDLSGQQKMRNTWKYYYETVNGIIFVLDASNEAQMGDARETLHQVISETVDEDIPILIFANK
jgi:small GTP-binding protein